MKNKIFNIIKFIIMIISLIVSGYFVMSLYKLNIVPTKKFILLIGSIIFINILIIIFIFLKKKLLNILGIIISIIMVVLLLFGVKNINIINNFFNKAFNNNNIEIAKYNLAVLKESKYNKLIDLNKKKIGYLSTEENKNFMNNIKSKITTEFIKYNDPYVLYKDLLNNKINSMIISEGVLHIIEDKHEDILRKIRIIYNFEEQEKLEKPKEVVDKPINILISGSDARSRSIPTRTRSDVNMIMTIDYKNRKILLTSIPRDYYVQSHGKPGLKDKLTHAGIYGINMSKQTLEDLFNIKINYTIKVGFYSVIEIVDLIGGIDIYSDISFNIYYSYNGNKGRKRVVRGMNHFNGAQALSYARERHAYITGDNHRVQNQQQVLEAIIDKISKNKNLLEKYDKLLESFKELYRTDIPSDLIKRIVKNQIDNMTSWTIEKQQVNGYGNMLLTYSIPNTYLWVMIPDMNSVNTARERILKIINNDTK